mgnify:CR=1 FL=1
MDGMEIKGLLSSTLIKKQYAATTLTRKLYSYKKIMNIERFHNELAMRLGYERIVKDKRIQISVEESEDPMVSLRVQGYDEISFKASDDPNMMNAQMSPELKEIVEAVHQTYIEANINRF